MSGAKVELGEPSSVSSFYQLSISRAQSYWETSLVVFDNVDLAEVADESVLVCSVRW